MRILLAHNFYKIQGGEDAVFSSEKEVLIENGHIVSEYKVRNRTINSIYRKIISAVGVIFSVSQFIRIYRLARAANLTLVHVHNYFPIITPAIFYVMNSRKIPVIHTLHNYRAICPTALLMHEGVVTQKSVTGRSWWTVSKRVYQGSIFGSFALACMVEFHKYVGTWTFTVDRFIALTEFSKNKYVEAGWPENKIVVKPNFIMDPFSGNVDFKKAGGYAIFVGRLSDEKGVVVLLESWRDIDFPLKIVGDGPLADYAKKNAGSNVEYLGKKDKSEVLDLVRNSSFILMPSTWYEGFPMVLVEAFACGTPALVSRLGSMEEIVTDGVTGLHFEAGNANDLAEKVKWMTNNPEKAREMGRNARKEYLEKYTPEKNYEMLMDIYQQAIDEAKRR